MNTEILLFAVCMLAAWSLYENSNLRDRCRELEKELARISQHTMNRHKARSEASRRGWQTRRNGWNIAAHAPDCAVALNGRHDCSCGVDAAKPVELDAAGTGITDGKGKNDR